MLNSVVYCFTSPKGAGYRFADCVTVRNGDQPDTGQTTDIDEGGDVPNVRNDDVPDVSDDPAGNRRWILRQLAEGRRLNAPDVAEWFKCSVKTAQRDLQSLKEEGRIEFVGVTRTGYYCLRKQPEAGQ